MKIIAAIVTYNRKDLLVDGINGILNQTQPVDEIIVIDNASTDGTEKIMNDLVQRENKISYHRMSENTGGAGGFHEAVKMAYEKGADWIWLMDDDVIPESTCLEKLLETNKTHGYKIIQPNRFYSESKNFIPFALNWNYHDIKGTEVNNYKTFEPKDNDVLEIATMPFEGPLINKEVIDKIGLPDKDYFIFYDDTDFSMRANLNGYKIGMCSNALLERQIEPKNNDNNKFHFTWRDYYSNRNLIYFYKKYKKFNNYHLRILIKFLRYQKQAIKSPLTTIKNFVSYKLLIKSFLDGYRGVRKKEINF